MLGQLEQTPQKDSPAGQQQPTQKPEQPGPRTRRQGLQALSSQPHQQSQIPGQPGHHQMQGSPLRQQGRQTPRWALPLPRRQELPPQKPRPASCWNQLRPQAGTVQRAPLQVQALPHWRLQNRRQRARRASAQALLPWRAQWAWRPLPRRRRARRVSQVPQPWRARRAQWPLLRRRKPWAQEPACHPCRNQRPSPPRKQKAPGRHRPSGAPQHRPSGAPQRAPSAVRWGRLSGSHQRRMETEQRVWRLQPFRHKVPHLQQGQPWGGLQREAPPIPTALDRRLASSPRRRQTAWAHR